MKNCYSILQLILVSCLAALSASATELSQSGTNTISGVVQFSNADPDILARLGPPGNEGMTDYALYANSYLPDSLSATKGVTGADKLINPYTLTVTANDVPRFYDVLSVISLDGQTEEYWTPTYASALLTSNSPPATVDFNECVALLEIRYQRPDGTPVAALGGRAVMNETATPNYYRGGYSSQPAGRMTNFLVVPSGVEFSLSIEVDTGTDIYADRITHLERHTLTYACDEKPILTLIIPEAGTLGRIVGNFNMAGKIELPTDGYQELLGRPVIKALGPSGNRRYGALDAEWPGPDLVRAFALENLLPSVPAQLWRVQAEMQFNEGHRFEYFQTPALGEGVNPGVAVTAGATTDLGDQFVMNPALLVGQVTLTGPLEFGGNTSALRGVIRSSDYDDDMDGIPDGVGATTINGSFVAATGVNELAPGATLATSGGAAAVSFAGDFNPATGAFEGDYEAALGMLDNQPGIWQRDGLSLTIYNVGTNGGPHVNEVIYITEDQPWRAALAPGERATNDVSYGFAEVCYRIKSPARFFNPRFTSSLGYHTNYDGAGNVLNSYRTTISSAYGLPNSASQATNEALLTLYVPAGSYTLLPAISIVDNDGGVSDTQLPAVEVSLVAGERYCIEECLSIVLTGPNCTTNSGFLTFADAYSCDSTLTNLSLTTTSVDFPGVRLGYSDIRILEPIGVPRSTLRTGHGLFPEFDGLTPDHYRNLVITAVAKDNKGRVATRQIIARYDFTPPVLDCRDITVASENGGDAAVTFAPLVSADDILVCTPPSGSTFPVGVTPVTCVARDLCRNTNTCAFNVTVRGPNEDCALRIALTQLSPPEVTITWDCAATLQCAPSITGPWTSLPGATSPYSTPADGPQKFFRLCVSGDCSGTTSPPPAVYEPFDYPHASALGSGNGGFGFAGAWNSAANLVIETTSLSFSPLATTGGSASGSGGSGGSRSLAAPLGADGTTVYLSFLLQPGNASAAGTVDGYYGLSLFGDTGSLFIGKPGGQGGGVGVSQEYVLENFGGTSQAFAGVTVTPQQTVLLVVKCEFAAGNDTFTLYVNPVPGSPEPATGAVKNDADIGTCGTLTLSSGYDPIHTFVLDEIRLGATYESVTPR